MTEPLELDVTSLGPLRQIGSGGQGRVFVRAEDPDGPVYKEYSPRVVDDVDVDALIRFVTFGRELAEPDRIALHGRVAWPEMIVRRDGVVRGFLMRQVPPEYTTELRFGAEPSRELAMVQYLLNPPSYLRDRGLRLDDRFRLEFLRDTAETLALLHRLGISVGDVSPNNMLFSLTARPRCFFIDSDGMRLGGESVLAPTETPDWQIGMDGEEVGTPATDLYKFGLLVIRVFAADQQATDPAAVPLRLRRPVTAVLSPDPHERLAASAWLGPLDRLIARGPRRAAPQPPPAEPEPLPDGESQPVPEPRRPVVRPVPRSLAAARRTWFATMSVVVLVLVGLIAAFGWGRGGSGGSGAAARPATLPANLPANILSTLYAPPTYPGIGSLPGLPTRLLPTLGPNILDAGAACLFGTLTAPNVRGGDGLTSAELAIGKLRCDVNRDVPTPGVVPVWQPLLAYRPYTGATVVGFFGEGTASPRVTVELPGADGKCWTTNVRFDAGYEVTSVGPLSRCG